MLLLLQHLLTLLLVLAYNPTPHFSLTHTYLVGTESLSLSHPRCCNSNLAGLLQPTQTDKQQNADIQTM